MCEAVSEAAEAHLSLHSGSQQGRYLGQVLVQTQSLIPGQRSERASEGVGLHSPLEQLLIVCCAQVGELIYGKLKDFEVHLPLIAR